MFSDIDCDDKITITLCSETLATAATGTNTSTKMTTSLNEINFIFLSILYEY